MMIPHLSSPWPSYRADYAVLLCGLLYVVLLTLYSWIQIGLHVFIDILKLAECISK